MSFKLVFNPLSGTFEQVLGDVFGPSSANSSAIATFSGVTGKLLLNNTVTLNGDGRLDFNSTAGSLFIDRNAGNVIRCGSLILDTVFNCNASATFGADAQFQGTAEFFSPIYASLQTQYETPVNGGTVSINDFQMVVIINPSSSALSSLTVNFPNGVAGQWLTILSTVPIASVVNLASNTIHRSSSAMSAYVSQQYLFEGNFLGEWLRMV